MAVDLNMDAAAETPHTITEQGGTCSAFRADVTRAEECVKRYGAIDILHNNVGTTGKLGGLMEIDEKDWDFVMNANAKSMFLTCRAIVPHMEARGGRRDRQHIVPGGDRALLPAHMALHSLEGGGEQLHRLSLIQEQAS